MKRESPGKVGDGMVCSNLSEYRSGRVVCFVVCLSLVFFLFMNDNRIVFKTQCKQSKFVFSCKNERKKGTVQKRKVKPT